MFTVSTGKRRAPPTAWKPGQSGNPAGRPKMDKPPIAELARAHCETALAVLVEIATGEEYPPSSRVAAASALLDRGYGRPPQSIDLSADEGAGLAFRIEWVTPPDAE